MTPPVPSTRQNTHPQLSVSPRRAWATACASIALLLLAAAPAFAQFETPNRSFHNSTAFPLEGRHQAAPCESCHVNGQQAGTPKTCFECHWIRRKDDIYQTRLGSQCEQCHRPAGWTAVRFDHGAMTGLPLNASHRQLDCQTCHLKAEFTAAPNCVTCHRKDYDASRSPAHAAAGFPVTCDACHRPSDNTWQTRGGAGFSHAAVFPLVGVHATQTCVACHAKNIYGGTPRDCVGCHEQEYARTQSPSHAAAGFPTTCETCHRPTDPQWRGGSFNHNTVFSLVGVHATQNCAACHKNNLYRGTPRDCVGCHRPDYDRTTAPSHASAGFSTACETCHRPADPQWRGATFNHATVFALVGVHANQACASCHRNNVYRGTPRDCVGCHQADYDRTTTPNHAAAGFPTACEACHRATDPQWRGQTFNHNAVFALVGRHAGAACTACHPNNSYRGTPRLCVGCHQTDYNRTTTPNHASAGFPTTCDSCHRATDPQWRGVTFNHTPFFALVGRHTAAACSTCHQNNVYRGTPRTCAGCHQADYTRTTNPNHAAAGFPITCETCHSGTDSTWRQGRFTHTKFPLKGPHRVTCAQCHTTPNNFLVFSCTVCHTRTKTDNDHKGEPGYRYDSIACYTCHPNGDH